MTSPSAVKAHLRTRPGWESCRIAARQPPRRPIRREKVWLLPQLRRTCNILDSSFHVSGIEEPMAHHSLPLSQCLSRTRTFLDTLPAATPKLITTVADSRVDIVGRCNNLYAVHCHHTEEMRDRFFPMAFAGLLPTFKSAIFVLILAS